MKKQKDNITLTSKIRLRRSVLHEIDSPVVMETHGGWGEVWKYCYRSFEGVVMEKNPKKAQRLAYDRPTWAVYECDCRVGLLSGIGNTQKVNFIDFDPYGEPWSLIDAFFSGPREWPEVIGIAVTDGLRQGLRLKKAWAIQSMSSAVERYGNEAIYAHYLEICQELLKEKAAQVGYTLRRWLGRYCGHVQNMTHYGAVFTLS